MTNIMDAINADRISKRSIDVVLERTYELLTAASGADLCEIVDPSRDAAHRDLLKSVYPQLMKNIRQTRT